jgi:hypothetical protein
MAGSRIQRWNSRTPFLVKVSGHKLESSQTRVFVWFSTLIFPFYKMLFTNRLKFTCFPGFFLFMFKTRVESASRKTVNTKYFRVFCQIDVQELYLRLIEKKRPGRIGIMRPRARPPPGWTKKI